MQMLRFAAIFACTLVVLYRAVVFVFAAPLRSNAHTLYKHIMQEALSSNGHNIFQTALALKSRPVANPRTLSRSLSETLYEDLGRVHSMDAIQKALDTTGRDNIMHTRRILEHNPKNYDSYCCTEVHQDDDEGGHSDLECALCLMESDDIDTDLLRLPCGLRTCRTCLQVHMMHVVRSNVCYDLFVYAYTLGQDRR